MRDFSNYYNKTNLNEKIVNDGTEIFDIALRDGYESYDVEIDNFPIRAVIYNKYNSNASSYYIMTKLNIHERGSIVNWKNQKWIVSTRPESNGVYIKSEMKLCNTFITLTGKTEQILIGTDPRTGKPIYKTIVTEPTKIPCVAEKTIYRNATDDAINLPDGQLLITIPYMKHSDLTYNKEMIIYDEPYKIINMDDTQSIDGIGIRKITLERVVN